MIFHIIIASLGYPEYAIRSAIGQKYDKKRIWVIMDDSLIPTVPVTEGEVTVWPRSGRNYCAKNQYEMIRDYVMPIAFNDDVLVFLDGDDMFIRNDALSIVYKEYARHSKCLLTYGSYCHRSDGHIGAFNGPYRKRKQFRQSQWHGTHLKTVRVGLWRHLPESVFKDKNGNWLQTASDCAMMYALLEMAGHDRIRHISKVIYEYNDENPENDHKVRSALQVETDKWLRTLPPFQRVEI